MRALELPNKVSPLKNLINIIARTEQVLDKLEEWFDRYTTDKVNRYQHMYVEGMGEWVLNSKKFVDWATVSGLSRLVCYGKGMPYFFYLSR
jgi:hypothetical protein